MTGYIDINRNRISNESPAYLVAEIGLNHNCDMELAKKMIKKANDCGINAVKFQTYITEKLILDNSDAYKLFKNLELKKSDFTQLSDYSKELGITFFSTPFCHECVDWLEELNVPCYKIASMDSDYYDLIKYIADTGKPIILSTGMSSFGIIEKAVNIIEKAGNNKIIILHTISKYPPKYEDMNLMMIEKMKSIFNYMIGFSDHTLDNTMSLVARVLGAVLFEKHFTIDKNLDGPDQAMSMIPEEFIDLKNKLKAVDEGLKINMHERSDVLIEKGARRSLYTCKDLKKGTMIEKEMINIVRPKGFFTPESVELFIGKTLKKDMKKNDMFDLTCIL